MLLTNLVGAARNAALAIVMTGVFMLSPSWADAQDARATRWFPLAQGNEWTFSSPNGGSRTIRCERAFGPYRFVTGLFGRDAWLGYSASARSNVYAWNADERRWHRMLRFGQWQGSTWTFDLSASDCDRFSASSSRLYGIFTPAGDFMTYPDEVTFTLRPEANAMCGQTDIASMVFAYDVGPVAIRLTSGDELLLATATVGGRRFPAAQPGAVDMAAARATAGRLGDFLRSQLSRAGVFAFPSLTGDLATVAPAFARAFGPALPERRDAAGRVVIGGKIVMDTNPGNVERTTVDGHPLATIWGVSSHPIQSFFYQPTLVDLVTGDVYQGKSAAAAGAGPLTFFGPLSPPANARLTGTFTPAQWGELERIVRDRVKP